MAFDSQSFFPGPSRARLLDAYLGQSLRDVPTPAAVIDKVIVERNCRQMLETCEKLGVGFCAHVKSHKVIASPLPSALKAASSL